MLSGEFKRRSLFASLPFFVSAILNIAIIPYVIRSIGLGDYGLWNIVLGIYVISNLPRLGFSEVFISETFTLKDVDKYKIELLYTNLYFGYFVITSTSIFLISYLFSDISLKLLIMGIVIGALEVITNRYKSFGETLGDHVAIYRTIAAAKLIQTVLVCILVQKLKIYSLFLGLSVFNILIILFFHSRYKLSWHKILDINKRAKLISLFKNKAPIFYTKILQRYFVDEGYKILLRVFWGYDIVGLYSFVMRVVQTVVKLLQQVLRPLLIERVLDNISVMRRVYRWGVILSIISIPFIYQIMQPISSYIIKYLKLEGNFSLPLNLSIIALAYSLNIISISAFYRVVRIERLTGLFRIEVLSLFALMIGIYASRNSLLFLVPYAAMVALKSLATIRLSIKN